VILRKGRMPLKNSQRGNGGTLPLQRCSTVLSEIRGVGGLRHL